MRSLTTRVPRRDYSPLHREFDDLLARFFGNDNDWLPGVAAGRFVPPVETYLRDGRLVVRVDLPGIDPKAIDIAVEGDRLTVKGERKDTREEGRGGRTYREVTYGAFERTMSLPWDVDSETVNATYKDGVLEITMKAPEKAGARKIAVAH